MSKNKYDIPDMGLTDKEFYTQACRWANASTLSTAVKWWQAFVEVIIREEYYNGTCRVPLLGTFNTRTVDEAIQKQTDVNGKTVYYRVPERNVPQFTPSDGFINDINMQGVTKAYRKRLKKNQLTQRDWERHFRAESCDLYDNLSEERVEQAKEKFQEKLIEKKKKFNKKVEPEDEED